MIGAVVRSGPRSRAARPGPELDLIEGALRAKPWAEDPIIFREPDLVTGYPDVVAVHTATSAPIQRPERDPLGVSHLRLLHHLWFTGGSSIEGASSTLGWSERHIRDFAEALVAASLLHIRGTYLRPRALTQIFTVREIVAIEAKVDRWAAALEQAIANTWFASHSFILLPDGKSVDDAKRAAARFGVGVMTYDGITTSVELPAVERRIPASYGSWLINEWVIQLAATGV